MKKATQKQVDEITKEVASMTEEQIREEVLKIRVRQRRQDIITQPQTPRFFTTVYVDSEEVLDKLTEWFCTIRREIPSFDWEPDWEEEEF